MLEPETFLVLRRDLTRGILRRALGGRRRARGAAQAIGIHRGEDHPLLPGILSGAWDE